MSESELLSSAFERMGASAPQAAVMAAQILKRAEQLATERKITREEAVAYLLKLVQSGRNGSVDTDFHSAPPPPQS